MAEAIQHMIERYGQLGLLAAILIVLVSMQADLRQVGKAVDDHESRIRVVEKVVR